MWEFNRVSYGSEGRKTPLWVWIVQRATAVLLGPLVLVHIVVPEAAGNRWLNTVLLALVLAHGVSGIWRLAIVPGVSRSGYRAALSTTIALIVFLAVLGIATVMASN